MKTAIKHENDEFLVMASNIYHVLTVVVNHPRTPNCGAITYENDHNCKNDMFLVITLKHVKLPRTQKDWLIAHENGIKHENNEFFVMPSNMYRVLRSL